MISLLALALVASTLPRPAVRVEPNACDAVSVDDVVTALRIELPAPPDDGPPAPPYVVTLACRGDRATITVAPPGPGAPTTFETNLAGSPTSVRPRIVALAIAEAVRDRERAPRPAPPPPPPPPPPVAPTPREAPPPRRAAPTATRLGAFGEASAWGSASTSLLGGGLRFDYARGPLALGLEAAVLHGERDLDLGTADVIASYAAPSIAWRVVLGSFEARFGAAYAVGFARLTGHPADARAAGATVSGAWAGPRAFLGLAAPLAGPLSLDVRGALGVVALPVVGDVTGTDPVALRGAWTTFQAGLSLAL